MEMNESDTDADIKELYCKNTDINLENERKLAFYTELQHSV